jgi:hypothetical protein
VANVLKDIGVQRAADIQLTMRPIYRLPVAGAVVLTDVVLTSHAQGLVQYPFDATVFRWDGERWLKQPCPDDLATSQRTGLCSVVLIEAQRLAPGQSLPEDAGHIPLFGWPNGKPALAGFYVAIIPIWRSAEDFPGPEPTEAAGSLFRLT